MPTDAQVALVCGTTLVLSISVAHFRQEVFSFEKAPVPAQTVSLTAKAETKPLAMPTRHTVQAGDTLFSLARHYYHDEGKFVAIFESNRATLRTPEQLQPGTVLVIPKTDTVTTTTIATEN